MAALLDQLRQMHRDLHALAQTDSEQEVTGRAFAMVDAVLAEARVRRPPESTLRSQIEEFITPDAVAGGEDVEVPKAADAAVLAGQSATLGFCVGLGRVDGRGALTNLSLDVPVADAFLMSLVVGGTSMS
jgi:hypothetical protein